MSPFIGPIPSSFSRKREKVGGAGLIERQPADHERRGLVAGVAPDARDDRHGRGERHELVDGAFEGADRVQGRQEGQDDVRREARYEIGVPRCSTAPMISLSCISASSDSRTASETSMSTAPRRSRPTKSQMAVRRAGGRPSRQREIGGMELLDATLDLHRLLTDHQGLDQRLLGVASDSTTWSRVARTSPW